MSPLPVHHRFRHRSLVPVCIYSHSSPGHVITCRRSSRWSGRHFLSSISLAHKTHYLNPLSISPCYVTSYSLHRNVVISCLLNKVFSLDWNCIKNKARCYKSILDLAGLLRGTTERRMLNTVGQRWLIFRSFFPALITFRLQQSRSDWEKYLFDVIKISFWCSLNNWD